MSSTDLARPRGDQALGPQKLIRERKTDLLIAGRYKIWSRKVEDVLLHTAVRKTVEVYVCRRDGYGGTPEELIAFCKDNISGYNYPAQDPTPRTVHAPGSI